MTPAQHLQILGAAELARINRRVDAAPMPDPETIAVLHSILAPAMARVLAADAAIEATAIPLAA